MRQWQPSPLGRRALAGHRTGWRPSRCIGLDSDAFELTAQCVAHDFGHFAGAGRGRRGGGLRAAGQFAPNHSSFVPDNQLQELDEDGVEEAFELQAEIPEKIRTGIWVSRCQSGLNLNTVV